MQLESEIRQSIEMFNFARLKIYHSSNRYPMLLVSLMQLIGALLTELICIFLICSQDSVQNVIMNFVALGVIAEIDDIYARTLYQNRIKQEIEDGKALDTTLPNQITSERWFHPTKAFFSVIFTFYQTYYYYFMPFTVIALTYIQELLRIPEFRAFLEQFIDLD